MSEINMKKIKKISTLSIDGYITLYEQDTDFKDLNIIYGLNGSGKTSVSRLIYDFSANKYNGIANNNTRTGKLECEDGLKDNSNDYGKFKNIFVFNCDFIDNNITEGLKNPSKNTNEIDFGSKIQEINKSIEDLENQKKGLEEDKKTEEKKKDKIIADFQELLSEYGLTKNKFNSAIAVKYIENYTKNNEHRLTEQQLNNIKDESRKLNSKDNQETKKEITKEEKFINYCDVILDELKKLLKNPQIASSEEIEKFNKNNDLKGYVKSIFYDVLEKNKEYQSQCPLCDTDTISIKGNQKSSFEDFYKTTLKNYFNEEKKTFDEKCNKIKDDINKLSKFNTDENNIRHGDDLLAEDKDKYKEYREELLPFFTYIKNEFCELMKQLINKKQKNIDTSNNDYKNDIEELIKKFDEAKDKYSKNVDNMNLIIGNYNRMISNRQNELEGKYKKLKDHYCFENNESYLNIKKCIGENDSKINSIKTDIENKNNEKRKEQIIFKNKYLDKINEDLEWKTTYLGIKLEIDNNDSVILCRGDIKNIKLKNLSEGEKNILLLIYFIHLVKDYKDNNKDNDVIVILDDPHSSLDDRNTHNLTTLLQTYLIKKSDVMQFFLFTHNANFLRKLNINLLQPIKKELAKKEVFEIEKYGSANKLKIKKIHNRWQNMAVEYVNEYLKYKNIYEGREEHSSKSPRKFLEEMQTYLYPSFDKIDVKKILDKIIVTFNIHEDDHFNRLDESEKKDNIKTFYKDLQSVENSYLKEHIILLEDAIKEYIENNNN
jgi:wobble nucleotide-excising tRNase